MEEFLMEEEKSKKNQRSVRNIIIIAVVSCLLIGIGALTVCKTRSAEDNAVSLKRSASHTDMFESADETYTSESSNANENNPLIHLKLLQKDVEIFKALMEEVKKELFVTET
jgi:flagellar basal body-associated protein FliL